MTNDALKTMENYNKTYSLSVFAAIYYVQEVVHFSFEGELCNLWPS